MECYVRNAAMSILSRKYEIDTLIPRDAFLLILAPLYEEYYVCNCYYLTGVSHTWLLRVLDV